jgi:EAL domain-containing protein (putative c-di-GMP-specific phosphodiesterase class I)
LPRIARSASKWRSTTWAGCASLRLWSELRPDYVKIDRHFVDGIDTDTVKLQFVRSMRQIRRDQRHA